MPILTYDLSYISPTLAWDRVRAWVEPSTPDGWIADGKVWLGDTPAPVASNGTGSVELTETPEGGGYQMRVDYWLPGENARRTWRSGWFEFTADADLADLVTIDVPGAPTTALGEHINSPTAHPAENITFTPTGAIAATDVQGAIEEVAAVGGALAAHASDTDNPHDVTAEQVGAIPLPASPTVGQKLVWNGTLWAPGLPEIVGTGSPEGVVAAVIGSRFINTEPGGYNGATWWEKIAGSGTTGWRAHGDTGWRDISSLLINGWTATRFLLKRANAGVYLDAAITPPDASASNVALMPSGFRAGVSSRTAASVAFSSTFAQTGIVALFGGSGSSNVRGSLTASGSASLHWHTTDPWPTTLPGTPA